MVTVNKPVDEVRSGPWRRGSRETVMATTWAELCPIILKSENPNCP